ncbi:hypothetical protein EDC04DRAFT_2735213, partial [Pisolithus marmoratus]
MLDLLVGLTCMLVVCQYEVCDLFACISAEWPHFHSAYWWHDSWKWVISCPVLTASLLDYLTSTLHVDIMTV